MKTWKLLIVGLVIHTVFFYSIFDIYFTSPIVHGMTPHVSPAPPPAKRLVFFSADGLRADKFFELDKNGETRVPFFRDVIEKRGVWGVSHTRVPTESRPGHVALIAGIYEDVSAIMKGWKENPVEFDSVFNESRNTWSWGSPDILPMFAKGASGDHVYTSMYSASFENFGAWEHSRLDTWVFDEVKNFFKKSKDDPELTKKLQQDKIVFFMHLLGIDTNGHARKPYSEAYLGNIKLIDRGIKEMEELIETYYGHDGKTAYVFSADHGMTDWGSHGAGDPEETLTPLVAWGAGVRGPVKEDSTHKYPDTFSQDWKLGHLRRTDIEQADVAPLMASLVGVNYPVNSEGTLTSDLLNVSDYELAEMMFANVRQLLEQYQLKMEMKKSTTLSIAFRQFSELTPTILADKHRHLRTLIQNGQFKDAIREAEYIMEVALRGLNYFQTYDRLFLGASICSGFIGWMTYILTLIFEEHSGIIRPKVKLEIQGRPYWKTDQGIQIIFSVLGLIITLLLYVQSLPWTNYLYCLIPVYLWMVVLLRFDILHQVYNYICVMKSKLYFITSLCLCLLGMEILVVGFFYRQMISVGLVYIGLLPLFTSQTTQKKPLLLWLLSCCLVSVFPLMPVVTGKRNTTYVIVGGMIVLLYSLFTWRSFDVRKSKTWKEKILFIIQLLVICVCIYFSGFVVSKGLSDWQRNISWSVLGLSFIAPLLGPSILYWRLQTIVLAFAAPFILLAISYEVLFIVCLCIMLYQWCSVECTANQKSHQLAQLSLESLDFRTESTSVTEKSKYFLVIQDIQRAFYCVFFTFAGFFATGNIASVNSFDPTSVLCYITVFSPFVMGALLIVKIVIPLILIASTVQAVHVITKAPLQGLVLLIVLLSDYMALHFFFLLRDYGSWLDIGTSISHYVIAMATIIVYILLIGASHVITTWSIRIPRWR